MSNIIYKSESYKIMGIMFDIHSNLGKGFSEIVYKDAIEYEFQQNKIPFQREKEFSVNYKDTVLNHKFYTDFLVYDKIILEIKTVDCFNNSHYNQCLNYLRVSKNKLAILANFNLVSFEYKRIISSKN